MLQVFVILIDAENKTEEISLGSLYVDSDMNGFIRKIEVEPYDWSDLDQYESYFDSFDPELPEVPLRVAIGPKEASTVGFFNSDGCEIDLDEEEEDRSKAILRSSMLERYEFILKSAYRLYERAVRGEPAFVGYHDPNQNKQLSLEDILKVKPPQSRLTKRKQRTVFHERNSIRPTLEGMKLQRVALLAEQPVSPEFPNEMVLDVVTTSKCFPYRGGYVLGVADARRPIIVFDNGDVSIGASDGFFTNLMACLMIDGNHILLWADQCAKSQVFLINNITTLFGGQVLNLT